MDNNNSRTAEESYPRKGLLFYRVLDSILLTTIYMGLSYGISSGRDLLKKETVNHQQNFKNAGEQAMAIAPLLCVLVPDDGVFTRREIARRIEKRKQEIESKNSETLNRP